MTKFILLLFVSSGKAGGGMSAEFNSIETCEAAGSAFYQEINKGRNTTFVGMIPVKWVCVEK